MHNTHNARTMTNMDLKIHKSLQSQTTIEGTKGELKNNNRETKRSDVLYEGRKISPCSTTVGARLAAHHDHPKSMRFRTSDL